MRADITLKDVQLGASFRLLAELIEAWDFLSFNEQLAVLEGPRNIKKKWFEDMERKKKEEQNK